MRLQPACGDNTPAIARCEPGEVIFRHRRDEVVADRPLVLETLPRHDRADRMTADIFRTRAAAPVPEESGDGVEPTRFERTTENIAFARIFRHVTRITCPAVGLSSTPRGRTLLGIPC